MPSSRATVLCRRTGRNSITRRSALARYVGATGDSSHCWGISKGGYFRPRKRGRPSCAGPLRESLRADQRPQLAPSHCALDQLDPLQLEPLQELPLHELPDQLEPLHGLPDQLLPLHELPLHELPDQLEPFHLPPDQLDPAASSAAICVELNGLPKMSCSPWSTTPFKVRWSEPRAASSDPVPVEGIWDCAAFSGEGRGAVSSAFRSSSPEPASFQLKECSLSELAMSIAFTWSGVACGYFWSSRATAPVVKAVASEVPLPRKYWSPSAPPG